ncbi:MAG: hypothetical protein LBU58_05705 [Clostridiales bacterium]|jgi:hypothetical protein|nr:hypothetical protein [Clostridiales bacterium]
MRTDNALRYDVMGTIVREYGDIDAERFISMIKCDTFDYTEWRRGQWNDMTIEEVYAEAVAHYEKKKNAGKGD